MDGVTLLLAAGLASICAGALAYAFLFQRISDQSNSAKRLEKFQAGVKPREVRKGTDLAARRSRVQDALKEVDERAKRASKVSLRTRLGQAGLSWSVRTFVLVSIALAGAAFLVTIAFSGSLVFALGVAFSAGLGLPRWLLTRMRNRRQAAFTDEFPNAVDVIVRGIKAGLPLNDCLRVIAQEAREPVATEFRLITESQGLGIQTSEAVEKLFDRMPLPEANFFAIVITIQQKAGGNLAEALGNLSTVLRDRKKMKGKIQAMSMEAKASGAIIGALPIVVMLLVYLTTPDYISLLWTERLGQVLLAASAFWMTCGVLVMRKMINFDF